MQSLVYKSNYQKCFAMDKDPTFHASSHPSLSPLQIDQLPLLVTLQETCSYNRLWPKSLGKLLTEYQGVPTQWTVLMNVCSDTQFSCLAKSAEQIIKYMLIMLLILTFINIFKAYVGLFIIDKFICKILNIDNTLDNFSI